MRISKSKQRTKLDRLKKAYENPRAILIKILQKGIDVLRGYSYDFDKNGERELLSKLSSSGFKVVFDVGCNVGEWSSTAVQYFPVARIHCFELSEGTFTTLAANLKGSNFVLNNMGMGDKDAVVEYKVSGKPAASFPSDPPLPRMPASTTVKEQAKWKASSDGVWAARHGRSCCGGMRPAGSLSARSASARA